MPFRYSALFPILSGLFLGLPWLNQFTAFFLFFAFVPLLYWEQSGYSEPGRVFLYASLSFFIWNTLAVWWIANASPAGAAAAIIINTFLFSVVFWIYHKTRKHTGILSGNIAFVVFWTAFEYFYLNAEISWPWLNLGNGLANDIYLIQWYEYTGILGGTIWILTLNVLFVSLIRIIPRRRPALAVYTMIISGLILIPVVFSYILFHKNTNKTDLCTVSVIQPDTDLSHTAPARRSQILVELASKTDQDVDYFIAPEVAITEGIRESAPSNSISIADLKSFLLHRPKAKFIFGAYTYGNPGSTAYNSAIQLDTGDIVRFYHKSKLVVGIEKMPYAKALQFLKSPVEKFGGSFSSFGTQAVRDVWPSSRKKFRAAPVICYESVYGEFVTGYIKNGANILIIITNDSWWGDTPGHIHLLGYARLRAIETRRPVARAASTGISAFINSKGEITDSLGWGRKGILTASMPVSEEITFYSKHGDYLGVSAAIISGLFLLMLFFKKYSRRPQG